MDYKKIVCELFRALRGEISQTVINKKLNFSYNQVSRWESGKVQPSWEDFLNFIDVVKVDISQEFGDFFRYHGDLRDYSNLMDYAFGSSPINQISNELRIAKSTLYSWKKRERVPPLYQMFRMLGHSLFNVDYFLDQITKGKILPTLRETRDHRQNMHKLYTEHPMAVGVAMCLDLGDYMALETHKEGFIAHKLSISIEEEEYYIEILKESGFLTVNDKGLYHVDMDSITVGGDWDEIFKVRMYWLQQQLKKMEQIRDSDILHQVIPYIFVIFHGNEELMKQIKERMNKAYSEINAMAEAFYQDKNDKSDQIFFFNMSLSHMSPDPEIKLKN